MKKLFLAVTMLIGSSMAFMSCNNGVYDANPDTNNSGISIPDPTPEGGSKFDWSGSDPMSAKVDGNTFHATSAAVNSSSGFFTISGSSSSTNNGFVIMFLSTPASNSIYNFSTTVSATYTEGSTIYSSNTAQGGSGGIKILENDASHVKGYFYGTFKSALGTKTVSEGYFNVNK